MVPTATIRPPRGARRVQPLRRGSIEMARFRVHPVLRHVSSAFTGRKVPGPTWSVTNSRPTPALREPVEQLRREVQAGGRRGDGALVRGIDGLVVGDVALVGRAPCAM